MGLAFLQTRAAAALGPKNPWGTYPLAPTAQAISCSPLNSDSPTTTVERAVTAPSGSVSSCYGFQLTPGQPTWQGGTWTVNLEWVVGDASSVGVHTLELARLDRLGNTVELITSKRFSPFIPTVTGEVMTLEFDGINTSIGTGGIAWLNLVLINRSGLFVDGVPQDPPPPIDQADRQVVLGVNNAEVPHSIVTSILPPSVASAAREVLTGAQPHNLLTATPHIL